MNSELEILRSNLAACGERVQKLKYSIDKNRQLFPTTPDAIANLSADQEESIDALVLRYTQCVSMIQDQIFKGIAFAEQEDLSDKSNRDKTLLMEKLGAIKSADAFGTAATLRNKFAHHYPEEAHRRIERLNLVIDEAEYVVTTFADIVRYLMKKGFAA